MAEEKKIPQLKSDPKYKDAPRYPLIYEYEGEFKKNYDKSLKVMVTQLASRMMEFVKDSK